MFRCQSLVLGQRIARLNWHVVSVIELSGIQLVVLLTAVLGVAFLYSSVGHGGATGYLAVMSLLGVSSSFARPGALWLNVCVAGIAFWRFNRAGHFEWRVFLPLACASIPMAWLGSRLHFEARVGAIVLGVSLAAAGWVLGWGQQPKPGAQPRMAALPLVVLAGAGLGFLAGLTGIGGGVFLTPLLIFLNWTQPKTAGGISALFIVANSISGLAGLGKRACIAQPEFFVAIALGVTGALLGTHLGVNRWRTQGFRRALAVVLWIAATKLLITGK